jgi:hypothetical protein
MAPCQPPPLWCCHCTRYDASQPGPPPPPCALPPACSSSHWAHTTWLCPWTAAPGCAASRAPAWARPMAGTPRAAGATRASVAATAARCWRVCGTTTATTTAQVGRGRGRHVSMPDACSHGGGCAPQLRGLHASALGMLLCSCCCQPPWHACLCGRAGRQLMMRWLSSQHALPLPRIPSWCSR